MKNEFLTDIQTLRQRARQHIERGAVTEGYQPDIKTAVRILNEALATEIICVLRYRRHYFMASGIHAQSVRLAERITQLRGEPDFSPQGLASRSHSEYKEGVSITDMIKEDLVAERVAIESYSEMIRYFGDKDPTTRRMLEEILAKEEEHADDLVTLLETLGETAKK